MKRREELLKSLKESPQTLDFQTSDSFIASSIVINEEFRASGEEQQMIDRIHMAQFNMPKQEMGTLNKRISPGFDPNNSAF